jgi:hypothetical protein
MGKTIPAKLMLSRNQNPPAGVKIAGRWAMERSFMTNRASLRPLLTGEGYSSSGAVVRPHRCMRRSGGV